MVNLNSAFPTQSNAPDANYTYGSAKNVTVPGDNTGTPFVALLQNDIIGLQQFLVNEAGITPSGSADTILACQQFDAMWKILNMRTVTHNMTSDADYTLTASENLKLRYVITDTNPFLTTARNINIDTVERRFLAVNNTLQTLTFKTIAGTGISVAAGAIADLYCDGMDVVRAKAESQLKSVVKTDTFTTTSTTWVDVTGVSVSITPSSTSSKILVGMVTHIGNTVVNEHTMVRLMRDSTPIAVGDAAGSRSPATGFMRPNDINDLFCVSANYPDEPATTSPITYKLQMQVETGTGTLNRSGADNDLVFYSRHATTLIVQEIGA